MTKQQELIRCIKTDEKTGKTKVVWLTKSVIERAGFMKNYGIRVEHVAAPTIPEYTEPTSVPEVPTFVLPEPTDEPNIEIKSIEEQSAPVQEEKPKGKPGRKAATNKKQ